MSDDDDIAEPPPRPTFDDKTAWGRINGRDRRRYARLWSVDLGRPRADNLMSGEEEFNLYVKMMTVAHCEAEDTARRPLNEEQFAAAWRPPPMSEMFEEEIERRRETERLKAD